MGNITSDAVKNRKLCFYKPTSGEVRRAVATLKKSGHVAAHKNGACVEVSYHLAEHSLEELEQVLVRNGLPPAGMAEAVKRGLIRYAEEVERENRDESTPEGRYQQLNAVAEERFHERVAREHPLPPEELRDYF